MPLGFGYCWALLMERALDSRAFATSTPQFSIPLLKTVNFTSFGGCTCSKMRLKLYYLYRRMQNLYNISFFTIYTYLSHKPNAFILFLIFFLKFFLHLASLSFYKVLGLPLMLFTYYHICYFSPSLDTIFFLWMVTTVS